jgi:3-keto-5-aminohexanoate cleavage enzyme
MSTQATADDAPVIIEVALNPFGGKERNPRSPVVPEEIAADALACLDAGASIIHTHSDDFSLLGEEAAQRYIEAWAPVLEKRPDAIIYGTGVSGATVQEKTDHYEPSKRGGMRMAVLDPGSTNFGSLDADGMPGHLQVVYANSYADIKFRFEQLDALALGPSIAIYEPGWLRTVLAYYHAGKLPRGSFVKLYFSDHSFFDGRKGCTYGLPPTLKALEAYLELLDGTDLVWCVAALGGDIVGSGLARHALERGGHLRVGLEDYAGPDMPSNVELVEGAADVVRAVGRPLAEPNTAARILDLPN